MQGDYVADEQQGHLANELREMMSIRRLRRRSLFERILRSIVQSILRVLLVFCFVCARTRLCSVSLIAVTV